ncbi:hypothetical protein HOP52_06755 [Halomonas campisalis]|uniref:DUF2946 domain-containing protein n=1 Tax=Billgrantia campisalis TaxID=74661 RepID=A0ABS9P7M3_9GAMM|nr:DUF2946 family protein [Halomonas campisalis]MCG6657464.1 hypothetical protein [Halomonas campisalis]MDR5863190.1 hypothetical protein [Halomonas campisalis]
MGRLDRTSLTQGTGGRWLAVLLAMLLAMVTLSSHGATQNHQIDCGVAAERMSDDGHSSGALGVEHDHDAASCATCTTAMGQALLPVVGPERQANSLAMAASPQIPLPPRRPPRA